MVFQKNQTKKIKNTAFNQLNSLATGIEFTQIVQSAPLSTIGPEGRAREIMNRFAGAGKSFMSTLDPIDDLKLKHLMKFQILL
jgi:hypothetical protein